MQQAGKGDANSKKLEFKVAEKVQPMTKEQEKEKQERDALIKASVDFYGGLPRSTSNSIRGDLRGDESREASFLHPEVQATSESTFDRVRIEGYLEKKGHSILSGWQVKRFLC